MDFIFTVVIDCFMAIVIAEQAEYIKCVPKYLHNFHQHVITISIEKVNLDHNTDAEYSQIWSCVYS